MGRSLPHMAGKIEVENILPWIAWNGPRLNLEKVDVPDRKDTQAFVECAGNIFKRENNRCFTGAFWNKGFFRQKDKAGEILLVVLDISFQDLHAIVFRCPGTGNCGAVVCAGIPDKPDRASGIVIGALFNGAQRLYKRLALGQGGWMGIDVPDVFYPCPVIGDKIVAYPQFDFADNGKRVFQEQIVVLVDAARKRILDRDDPAINPSFLYGVKNLLKIRERDCPDLCGKILHCREFAERAVFSLKCDCLHGWSPCLSFKIEPFGQYKPRAVIGVVKGRHRDSLGKAGMGEFAVADIESHMIYGKPVDFKKYQVAHPQVFGPDPFAISGLFLGTVRQVNAFRVPIDLFDKTRAIHARHTHAAPFVGNVLERLDCAHHAFLVDIHKTRERGCLGPRCAVRVSAEPVGGRTGKEASDNKYGRCPNQGKDKKFFFHAICDNKYLDIWPSIARKMA